MRCAFDLEGARLAAARLTGVHLLRVRRQEIADENPRCPADRLGVTGEDAPTDLAKAPNWPKAA